MPNNESNIIIYNTPDGKASVALYTRDGKVWLSQQQIAELFGTSKQNIGQHIASILKDKELVSDSVVKNYFNLSSTKIYRRVGGRKKHIKTLKNI